MKEVTTYLNFEGNCKDAMTFYAKCLGAELQVMPFSVAPGDIPAEAKERVMHASLTKGRPILMASDTMPGSSSLKQGNNFSIAIQCESLEEIERLFTALSENATVGMPLADAFWGARFGMLTDQFGIQWMFNYEYPKQG